MKNIHLLSLILRLQAVREAATKNTEIAAIVVNALLGIFMLAALHIYDAALYPLRK